MRPRFERDGLVVEWLDGAVYVEHEGLGLLLDAPAGVEGRLGERLARLQAVVLTSGRINAVGGLVPLLVALEAHRAVDVPVSLRHLLGEERGAMLAETWVRGWPDAYPVTLDAELPGATFDVGALTVTTVPIRAGEPRWRTGTVERLLAVAVRLEVGDTTVVWVPGAAPGTVVQRACAGADLAIVEVGTVPWPRTREGGVEVRWRMSVGEAVQLAGDAGTLWLVGDDGRFGPDEAH